MNENPAKGNGKPSMEWITQRLRTLSAIAPPESLRARLLAAIPPAASPEPRVRCLQGWPRGVRWAAAAAVLTAGSVVAWLGASWVGQGRPPVDANVSISRVYAFDHNGVQPSDMNLCDSNSLR